MIDGFIISALIAGIGVAVAAGPLGCFVVWRRMAYFGDATAHAAVLGVAVALLAEIPILLGVLLAALGMAVAVTARRERGLAADTLLGVAAHASLALGLVAVSLAPGRPVDLEAYLFGDILALSHVDIAVIWIGALGILAVLTMRWTRLLTITLNDDLANAEGLTPDRDRLLLAFCLATLVAVAIKVVGALLITAMLIIPAAAARSLARTPEQMAGAAIGIGIVGVAGGLALSLSIDTPVGPSIVVAITALFLLSLPLTRIR